MLSLNYVMRVCSHKCSQSHHGSLLHSYVLHLLQHTIFFLQLRCSDLEIENSQLQEEVQRLRQHASGGGGGGGGGGGQRVRQLQQDNEHLRHQVCTLYMCVCSV